MGSSITIHRRQFLRTGMAGLVVLAASRPSHARTQASIVTTRLADDLLLLSGGGGNLVMLTTAAGLLLVNGGHPTHTSALMDAVKRETGEAPIKVLINTDWCPDHTGLNATAAAAGAKIIAHENTKLWLGARINVKWQSKVYQPLPKAARPNASFHTVDELTFGTQRVVYGHLGQAHTDGDCYVYFPSANVLVAGHTVGVGAYPVPDYCTGGWIGGLVNGTRTLLGVANGETRVVASHGTVLGRAQLQEQSDMLTAVRDRCVKMMKSGLSAAEMIAAAPTKEFDAKWGSPEALMKNMYPGLWGHARELGGII